MADQTTTADMPHYAPNYYYPPPPAGTRSRGSSAASRYVPDNYPMPPTISKTENNEFLAPPEPNSQREEDPQAFTPTRPEQYRAPQATQGIPPAQLRPTHPNGYLRTRSEGYDPRRSGEARRPSSADSRYSDDPRRSYHSTRSHRSSHDSHRDARRREHERRREDEEAEDYVRREMRHQKHHHHHHDDEDDDTRLRRRDTPRG